MSKSIQDSKILGRKDSEKREHAGRVENLSRYVSCYQTSANVKAINKKDKDKLLSLINKKYVDLNQKHTLIDTKVCGRMLLELTPICQTHQKSNMVIITIVKLRDFKINALSSFDVDSLHKTSIFHSLL